MMVLIKNIIKAKSPFLAHTLRTVYISIHQYVYRSKIRHMSIAERFEYINKNNIWGNPDSVSGQGSTLEQTTEIRKVFPKIAKEFKIESLLDIPCGDYFWMRHVDLSFLESYIGADIIDDLVFANSKYATQKRSFRYINLLSDHMPPVDLILCRDCLVHFSFSDIFTAIENISRSGSKYLLTTTYYNTNRQNVDILTGEWRPINLQLPPFNFPPPIVLIDEQCTERGRTDKALGLWEIADIS